MPFYQNSSVNATLLIVGNAKMETSVYASAAGSFTWVNLGAGMLKSTAHTVDKYSVQAGNAPDPIEGVAREVATAEIDLIEFDLSVLSALSGGLTTTASTGTVMTTYAGGNTTLTPRAYRFTNTRLVSGATKQTILTFFSATPDAGPSIAWKSDNDQDAIGVASFTITAEQDTTRSVGTQLYTLTKTI